MKSAWRRPQVCFQCRPLVRRTPLQLFHNSSKRPSSSSSSSNTAANAPPRPTTAPKPNIDIRHIRQNPELHAQNCLDRNYKAQAAYPARINDLFGQWQARQHEGRSLRERGNLVRRQIANPASIQHEGDDEQQHQKTPASKEELLEEARKLKQELSVIEQDEARLTAEMESLALVLPNLTSPDTPRGDEPRLLTTINDHPEPEPASSDRVWRSHVHIGTELGLIDLAGAATTSGWGWYFLLDDGARLEQALVSYALDITCRHFGWRQVSPPSIVYSHIGAACGFQPRDANGEQQVYGLAQSTSDAARGRPELVLAGTAEIPLAGMQADTTLEAGDLPLRRVAASRCYRAEAGARGADTKGLYRVHEFTKVEMFAWTIPDDDGAAQDVMDEMLDIQTEILQSLGLHCRVLEMPTSDLGASASRKVDIEAFFPSRRAAGLNDGWGELTSTSSCTDYQSRRLNTRLRINGSSSGGGGGGKGGKLMYPYTLNGTAMAVPRVLAALLENGWDEADKSVTLPECLWPYMGGMEKITRRGGN